MTTTAWLSLALLVIALCLAQDQDQASEQDDADSESIWIQAAFWPMRQADTEPFFEVQWPTSKDADGAGADPGAHVVVPPRDRHWAAQFTIAETIEQFPELIAPADVLSLEIRQVQDSDTFVIVLEVDDQAFNVTRAITYLDDLVGADRRLADQLLRPTPSGNAFATIPLDLIDFWRLDMRVVPDAVEPGAPVALVAAVSAPDMIASPFFGLSRSSARGPASPAALDSWLESRRGLWRISPASAQVESQNIAAADAAADPGLALVTRYLRVVGQYALYAEVVRHDPSPVALTIEFNADSDETETEVILAHWGLDRQLGGRILHVGGGQRRTVSLSSPIWYDGVSQATTVRTLTGAGFHRHLETALLLRASTPAPCTVSLMLVEFLPPGAYIDPDEIERLQRFRGLRISVLGDPINVEAPESVSKQNVVVLHLDNVTRAQAEPQWLNVSVPIHLRYQRPAAGGQHAPVRMPDPVVFAAFAQADGAAVSDGPQCPKTGTIWPQPFLVESHLQQCPGWHTVVLDAGAARTTAPEPEARIPRGDSDQQPFVKLVTFAATTIGACAVVVAIWASSSSSSSVSPKPAIDDDSAKKRQ